MSGIETASRVLRDEADAVISLVDKLDGQFEEAVHLIEQAKGRVVLTGMGKSGHIARKVAATMASTGTPAFFLHPAEGIHGDLGMVTADDVVVAYSNSGETAEVLNILPSLKRIGAKLIAVVGRQSPPWRRTQTSYWMQEWRRKRTVWDWLLPAPPPPPWPWEMHWLYVLWKDIILQQIILRFFTPAVLWERNFFSPWKW